MIIRSNIEILDDNGNSASGKLCRFNYSYEIVRHPLDGVYGVSGAERDLKDCYKEKFHKKVLGIWREGTNCIQTIYGEVIDLSSVTLEDAKVIDVQKLLEE